MSLKNLLSENMLRFGTKNLTGYQQRELVVKSIMETINQHGLHGEVRRRLMEADEPKTKDWAFPHDSWAFDGAVNAGVKFKPPGQDDQGVTIKYGPLVYQSANSVTEGSSVLKKLIDTLSKIKGGAEPNLIAGPLKEVTANNYYAILWKVKYGSTFKSITGSNYSTVTDWISNAMGGFDIPSSSGDTVGSSDDGSGSWVYKVRNWFQDPTIWNSVKRLQKYNMREGRQLSGSGL